MPRRRPNTKSPAQDKGRNFLRIIGGKWRGRKLAFPSIDGLRPTGDRIRETLFNWLTAELPGSQCLDLFAGSGALGLEALSRGAGQVTLLEKDSSAANQLRQHLTTLEASDGQVINSDSLTWLKQPASPVDIVFIDPPFQADLWQSVCEALENGGWLKAGSAIYIETPKDTLFSAPTNWQLHREKHSGQVSYRLYFRE
ncbi:16S rRNA (guanine(966)-N(2))-methyltransferase RsmD [Maricurvus nonylphenolicus]|uniref:16S rRNA (guanine(966)-N(2))-methyltransferase RsmD n=1 Tax=Maricurvus nonylphenolicus TaxID=1008307 RepID=UPI0036F2C0DC